MEFSSPSDDVLTGLLNTTLHHRVGLCQTLQTLHQLGQISRVLALYSYAHHRAYTELHHLHVVGLCVGGDGTSLDEELINTDETADVSAGHILDGLDVATHHQDGTLDGLQVQILLL